MKQPFFNLHWLMLFSSIALVLLIVLQAGCGQGSELPVSPERGEAMKSAPQASHEIGRRASRVADAQGKFMQGDFLAAIEILEELRSVESIPGIDSADSDFALGEIYFANGEAAKAVAAFDRVIAVRPGLKPRLWQRGLALFYADRYEDVIDQLESHQTFNTQDVENSVWHLLCKAKLSSLEEARKDMIEITHDSRMAMPEIYELFAGRGTVEQVMKIADASADASTIYHALLYVGLFHEMVGDRKKSQAAIEAAIRKNPFGPTVFMGNVSHMHAKARGFEVIDKSEK